MRVTLKSTEFTEITIESGTIQNVSPHAPVEVASTQTENTGILLLPYESLQYGDNATVYARGAWDSEEVYEVAVEPFKRAGEGGGYTLPIATSSKLGGVKVGSNLSIDESGVLSAPVNYSTTEQQIGTWTDGKPLYQKTVAFTLPNDTGFQDYSFLPSIPFSNIDTLVDISGWCMRYDGWRVPHLFFQNSVLFFALDWNKTDSKLYFYVNTNAGSLTAGQPATLTFTYTKITD